MARFDAITFDLDDTLLDRRKTFRLYAEALFTQLRSLWKTEVLPDEFVRQVAVFDRLGYAPRQEFVERIVDEFGREGAIANRGRIVKELLDNFYEGFAALAVPMPGMTEALQAARGAGLKIALVTNGSTQNQRAKIAALGLKALVDSIHISSEEGVHKPDPEIFKRACDKLDVAMARTMHVGDHPINDMAGARAAGFGETLWLTPSDKPWPEELGKPEPPRIESLREFPKWLFGNNG